MADPLRDSFAVDGPECVSPHGREPLPFQRGGVAYALGALSRRGACLIGDDMGLGKTIQALCIANMTAAKHTLVVCPASVRINWKREADKWLLYSRYKIVGYEEAVRHPERIRGTWDQVVFDEAQYLKTFDAKRTEACFSVKARNRLFLSGTPVVNRPIELWPILNNIDPQQWPCRHEFGLNYCQAFPQRKYTRKGVITEWNYKGATNLVALQHWLRSNIMVRRLKKDVLKDLPPKTRQLIELPSTYARATGNLLAQVRKIWAAKRSTLSEGSVSAMAKGEAVTQETMAKIRHEQALDKVPAVAAHVRDVLDSTDKVIVFCHHRDVAALLMQELAAFKPVKLIGGMTDKAKQASQDAFQLGDARVFIGQIEAAGTGITLTAANVVIFAELDWVPGRMSQCEDRAYRIGQTLPVTVQHIVLANSLDVLISKTLMRKQRILDQILDGGYPEEAIDWVETLSTEQMEAA
jgi:SWI/SNF-related matrix-associated actin-dependent regulator of chromatin subfamily A-like protein 1